MTSDHTQSRQPPVRWHVSDGANDWTTRAVDAIAKAVQRDLDQGRDALLLLSGGNTPAPVYRVLGDADLDWRRVHIGLVDERWAAPGSAGNNARLIRDTLLAGRAADAGFAALVDTLDDPTLAARRASDWLGVLDLAPSAMVFGMGDDGHTASLFPRAGGLEHALSTHEAYALIDAAGCDGAGAWPTRISATPALFAKAGTRLLLIHGATKRHVLERALSGDDVREFPVRSLAAFGDSSLDVHWYP